MMSERESEGTRFRRLSDTPNAFHIRRTRWTLSYLYLIARYAWLQQYSAFPPVLRTYNKRALAVLSCDCPLINAHLYKAFQQIAQL